LTSHFKLHIIILFRSPGDMSDAAAAMFRHSCLAVVVLTRFGMERAAYFITLSIQLFL